MCFTPWSTWINTSLQRQRWAGIWKQPLFWAGLMFCSHCVGHAQLGQDESITWLEGVIFFQAGDPSMPLQWKDSHLQWKDLLFFPLYFWTDEVRKRHWWQYFVFYYWKQGWVALFYQTCVCAGSWQVVHSPQTAMAVLGSGTALTLCAGGEGFFFLFLFRICLWKVSPVITALILLPGIALRAACKAEIPARRWRFTDLRYLGLHSSPRSSCHVYKCVWTQAYKLPIRSPMPGYTGICLWTLLCHQGDVLKRVPGWAVVLAFHLPPCEHSIHILKHP